MKKNFVFYQPNPTELQVVNTGRIGDCVVRALCAATGQDWKSVARSLFDFALERHCMPNCNHLYGDWLISLGFQKGKIPAVKRGQKRLNVAKFATLHADKICVVSEAHHLVCCKDGKYYDSWDCGDRTAYTYWYKEINK